MAASFTSSIVSSKLAATAPSRGRRLNPAALALLANYHDHRLFQ